MDALPPDLDIAHVIAISAVFITWFGYPIILKIMERRSLNSRLEIVRQRWIRQVVGRKSQPFDALLLGHIINSVAFFGSATLLVLAGLLSAFLALKSLHTTLGELHFIAQTSFELFTLKYLVVAFVVGLSFFSYTYALRKLIYLTALMGALPDGDTFDEETNGPLVDQAAIVLTEATITFNFGIRGFYYAASSLLLVVSPWASLVATLAATFVLMYRQLGTKTAKAIRSYVSTIER